MALIKNSASAPVENVLSAPVKNSVLRAPNKNVRLINMEDEPYVPIVNLGFMGLPSTGKTKFLADLIEAGAKVFTLNTDPGGCGDETILAQCKRNGTLDKFKSNFRAIAISDYDTVQEFLENPAKFYPKIWEFSPDFMAWEGFSNFQQTQLSDKVASLYEESASSSNKKEVVEARAEGLKFETQDWGLIRNSTIRRLEDFMQISNPSGKPLHHILSMHENVETTQIKDANGLSRSEEKASGRPAIQGAAKSFLGGGFALVLRTIRDGEKYFYENSSKTLGLTKNRGINLPEGKFAAKPMDVIERIEDSYGIELFERS
jgi:hypothetical protein